MANIVMAKYYNAPKVVARCKAERNRKINRRKSAIERRRLRNLNQNKQSDDKLDIILLYVR